MLTKARWLAAAGMMSLLALGCGGSNNRKPTFPARGQITYDGKTTPQALVVFHPVGGDDKETPRPRGTVGPDGSFVVGTYDGTDGAPAGEYDVTVEWWQIRSTRKEDVEAPPVNKLPQRYSNARSSGVRVQIKEGENELPPIVLKK